MDINRLLNLAKTFSTAANIKKYCFPLFRKDSNINTANNMLDNKARQSILSKYLNIIYLSKY